MEKKGQIKKDEILYLTFHINQKFNPRPISKRDKRGNIITLVSLGFPYQSKYWGCYISVNASFIKDDKYHLGVRQQISILANAPFKVYKYDKETRKATLVCTLLGKEVYDEFNAWQSKEDIDDCKNETNNTNKN